MPVGGTKHTTDRFEISMEGARSFADPRMVQSGTTGGPGRVSDAIGVFNCLATHWRGAHIPKPHRVSQCRGGFGGPNADFFVGW
jgi:hypothetical protein